jgi:glycosyltransferase involved in cell wall biosynthesis
MPRADLQRGQPDRIRVVTLVDFLSMQAGAERIAVLIATRLNRERFDSTLCVSRWPRPPGEEERAEQALEALAAAGVRFFPLGRQRKMDVWVWARLERLLRRERVHVLHAHKFGSNVWGALIGRMAQVPVVLAHEHTWSYEGQPVRRFLDREVVARGADRFIAVSREDQRRMIEVEGIDPSRTLFIPNGVLGSPPPSGRNMRAELGIEPDAPVVGTVAMLRPQKALPVLLRATLVLRARWPRLRVLIVGDGPERESLERLTDELGIRESVRFLGHRADVPDVLGALDVAVSCSDFEGSPLSVMEYMEAALPIVATAVGGLPELIESGVHGLLVTPGDPRSLAEAVQELLTDRARAIAMGRCAQRRRRSEFDIATMVERVEALYAELLAAYRARHSSAGDPTIPPTRLR